MHIDALRCLHVTTAPQSAMLGARSWESGAG